MTGVQTYSYLSAEIYLDPLIGSLVAISPVNAADVTIKELFFRCGGFPSRWYRRPLTIIELQEIISWLEKAFNFWLFYKIVLYELELFPLSNHRVKVKGKS